MQLIKSNILITQSDYSIKTTTEFEKLLRNTVTSRRRDAQSLEPVFTLQTRLDITGPQCQLSASNSCDLNI